MKSLDGYDYTHVRMPDGYDIGQPASLEFIDRAQDLVFHGRTGRGKTHLATALGVKAIGGRPGRALLPERRTRPAAGQGQTRRHPRPDPQGPGPRRPDHPRRIRPRALRRRRRAPALPDQRRRIIFTTNIEFGKWGTIFSDDELAAAIIDRIVYHGRLIEFHDPSRRVSQALMFNNTNQ